MVSPSPENAREPPRVITTAIRGPVLDFRFADDVLGSGTRHALATLRSKIPELCEFAETPVLQFGAGISSTNLFDHYDIQGFITSIKTASPDTYARAQQLYDSRLECVMDGYRLIVLLSDNLLKMQE